MIFPIPLTHRLERSPNGGMNFLKKACHSSHLEVAIQVHSAVGTCAVMCHRYSNSMSMSLSMSLSMSVSISVSVFVSVSLSVSVNESVSIKYGATNIFVRCGNYLVSFQGPYEVARKLKGPLTREEMDKIS